MVKSVKALAADSLRLCVNPSLRANASNSAWRKANNGVKPDKVWVNRHYSFIYI